MRKWGQGGNDTGAWEGVGVVGSIRDKKKGLAQETTPRVRALTNLEGEGGSDDEIYPGSLPFEPDRLPAEAHRVGPAVPIELVHEAHVVVVQA